MIRRPPRSTPLYSSAASDVYKRQVPGLVKESIEKAGLELADIKKVFIHQANEKMDEAILSNLFKLYDEKNIPEGIMPMSIRKLGNSSTGTVPTLLDLV